MVAKHASDWYCHDHLTTDDGPPTHPSTRPYRMDARRRPQTHSGGAGDGGIERTTIEDTNLEVSKRRSLRYVAS